MKEEISKCRSSRKQNSINDEVFEQQKSENYDEREDTKSDNSMDISNIDQDSIKGNENRTSRLARDWSKEFSEEEKEQIFGNNQVIIDLFN